MSGSAPPCQCPQRSHKRLRGHCQLGRGCPAEGPPDSSVTLFVCHFSWGIAVLNKVSKAKVMEELLKGKLLWKYFHFSGKTNPMGPSRLSFSIQM